MKAINDCLIIEKEQPKPKKVGGLILTEKLDEDNRYLKARVISSGDMVKFVKEGDSIYYDKHAGHGLSVNDKLYHVIRLRDIVVVVD
tara:strand:- start:287 stop:547 length:261 start_codon:yes stop_codon:yes gene_type:complete